MAREILHLPSAEGHGEYDLYVRAPDGMSADNARERVNTEITRANREDRENANGGCNDGHSVEDSLKAVLSTEGFEFFKPAMTRCWDENPS